MREAPSQHEVPYEMLGIYAPSPLPRLDARERISKRLLKFQKRMLDVEACVGFARDALEVSADISVELIEGKPPTTRSAVIPRWSGQLRQS
jgi:hypothetical protein